MESHPSGATGSRSPYHLGKLFRSGVVRPGLAPIATISRQSRTPYQLRTAYDPGDGEVAIRNGPDAADAS
jgi:hypothetical protein